MQVVRMKAERRSALGRTQVQQLRKQGWLPAIVYGEGKDPMPISVSEWELEQHVKAHQKVFHIEVDGQKQAAYLQEVVWHLTTDRPVHADFKRIDLTKPIETEVEIEFLGHPIGLSKGGTLIKDHVSIRVRCLPTAIPESLELNVAPLELDQFLTAGQVPLPAGIELVTPAHTSVCHVAKIVVQEVAAPAPAAAAAGEAPAAGAAGAAPAAAPAGEKEGGKEKKG